LRCVCASFFLLDLSTFDLRSSLSLILLTQAGHPHSFSPLFVLFDMVPSAVLFALAAASIVSANNDWSKPCLSGSCEYGACIDFRYKLDDEHTFTDLPASAGSASGTLKIVSKDTLNRYSPVSPMGLVGPNELDSRYYACSWVGDHWLLGHRA